MFEVLNVPLALAFACFRPKRTTEPMTSSRSPRRVSAHAASARADRSSMSRSIVVVGAGNAAGYLVRALVSADPTLGARTLVIGAEDVAPYERPALTKGFLHKESPPRLARFPHLRRRRRRATNARVVRTARGGAEAEHDGDGGGFQEPDGDDERGRVDRLRNVGRRHGMRRHSAPRRRSKGDALAGVHYVRNNADATSARGRDGQAAQRRRWSSAVATSVWKCAASLRHAWLETGGGDDGAARHGDGLWNADIAQALRGDCTSNAGTTFHRSSTLGKDNFGRRRRQGHGRELELAGGRCSTRT